MAKDKPRKKIGILGGSFNPPHLGHVGICRYVLDDRQVDAVWVIPCFEHPFEKELVAFEHRFKMCQLAFESFKDKVKVLDVEKKLGGKSYTLRTVEHLKKKFPDFEFFLLMGEDAAQEAKTWHQYEELKKALAWQIVPRGVSSPIPNVSATEIREGYQDKRSFAKYLPPEVADYLSKKSLY